MNSISSPDVCDELLNRIKSMKRDQIMLKMTKADLKVKYVDIYNASSHLFDAMVTNSMDPKMLETMISMLKKKVAAQDEKDSDQADRDMGKILADKYLYPVVGKQPVLSRKQEDLLIEKVKKENEKETANPDTSNRTKIKLE